MDGLGNLMRWILGGCGIIGLGVLLWWLNSGYGELSEKGYDIGLALISAVSRKDTTRLAQIEAMISEAQSKDEVGVKEGEWLLAIVSEAKQGNWSKAKQRARALLDSQIRQAEPLGS